MTTQKLVWEDKYSVGVVEIDNQHKKIFDIINKLLDLISTNAAKESLGGVIESLVAYKTEHFATEEKYFKEFNYEDAEEHVKEHNKFNEKLSEMKSKYPELTIEFAFELIDFLEDWLIIHLMTADQKYRECFKSHGLK